MPPDRFLDLLLAGRVRREDVDDWVEAWHDRYDGPLELHEYLGMTEAEYDRWVLDPSALESIVAARRRDIVSWPV